MDVDFSHIVTQIFAFLIMLWVLKKFGWQPLLNMLEERKNLIKSEFESIENKKDAVLKLSDQYEQKLSNIENQARHRIQEAVEQGQKLAHEIQDEAHRKAKEILTQAKEEIKLEVNSAKIHLKKDMANLVVAATEKLLQHQLDGEGHKKLIENLLQKEEIFND